MPLLSVVWNYQVRNNMYYLKRKCKHKHVIWWYEEVYILTAGRWVSFNLQPHVPFWIYVLCHLLRFSYETDIKWLCTSVVWHHEYAIAKYLIDMIKTGIFSDCKLENFTTETIMPRAGAAEFQNVVKIPCWLNMNGRYNHNKDATQNRVHIIWDTLYMYDTEQTKPTLQINGPWRIWLLP